MEVKALNTSIGIGTQKIAEGKAGMIHLTRISPHRS
jgi:hypothetical protein